MESQILTDDDTSSDYSIADGWYSLPELLFYLYDTHGLTFVYDASSNRVTQSGTTNYSMTSGLSALMGWTMASSTNPETAPPATWYAGKLTFKPMWEIGGTGKRIYTIQNITSIDGTVFTLSQGEYRTELFYLQHIDRDIFLGNADTLDFTKRYEDVFMPTYGIEFIFFRAQTTAELNIDYSTGVTWIGKKWKISDWKTMMESKKRQYEINEKWWEIEIPLIYVDDGDPST